MCIITRKQFQDAIEAGIAAAPEFSPEAIEALREVGRSATSTVWSDFYSDGVRCPLSAAGLYRAPAVAADWLFITGFDDAMRLLGVRACVAVLIED